MYIFKALYNVDIGERYIIHRFSNHLASNVVVGGSRLKSAAIFSNVPANYAPAAVENTSELTLVITSQMVRLSFQSKDRFTR